jgi:MFS family permease
MRNDVEGNIVKYYLYKLFANSGMRGPILVMFMTTTCKMPLSEVYFCEACCVIILAALQIPMGILADRWGRVKTIRIGCLFIVLELLGFAISRFHKLQIG